MKIKNKIGFTLAEIMVVLAVLSVLLAVMLPAMTKKRPEEIIIDPIWKRHESGAAKSIYYGVGSKQAALIGGRYNASGDNTRLVIHSANDDQIQFLTKYKKNINENDYEFLRGIYFGNNKNMYLGAFVGENIATADSGYTVGESIDAYSINQNVLDQVAKSFGSGGGSKNLVIRPNGTCGYGLTSTTNNTDSIQYNENYSSGVKNRYCYAPMPSGDRNTIIGYMAFSNFPIYEYKQGINQVTFPRTVNTNNHIAIGAYASFDTYCGSGCNFLTTIGYHAGSKSYIPGRSGTGYTQPKQHYSGSWHYSPIDDITAIGAYSGYNMGKYYAYETIPDGLKDNGWDTGDVRQELEDNYYSPYKQITAIGAYSALSHSGYNNTFIGGYAGANSVESDNNIAIGYKAFSATYAPWTPTNYWNDIPITYSKPLEYIKDSINIGAYSGFTNSSLSAIAQTGSISAAKEYLNKYGGGQGNISIGAYSNANNPTFLARPSEGPVHYIETTPTPRPANYNMAIGYQAKTSGEYNTVLTSQGGNLEGWSNTLVGEAFDLNPYASATSTYGYSKNVFVGKDIHGSSGTAGIRTPETSSRRSVYIGYNSSVRGGDGGVQIGYNSTGTKSDMFFIDDAKHNIGIGYGACNYIGSDAQNKTCIGYNSGPLDLSAHSVSPFGGANNNLKIIYLGNLDSTVYMPHIRVNKYVSLSNARVETAQAIVYPYSPFNENNYEASLINWFNTNHGKPFGLVDRAELYIYDKEQGYNYPLQIKAEDDTDTCGDGDYRCYVATSTKGIGGYRHAGDLVYAVYYLYSDKRLKNTTSEYKSGLDKIRQIKVFDYTFKADKTKKPHVGVIAQDLQKIFPGAVSKDENGYLTIRLSDMFYAVVNAVKELNNYIEGIYAQLDVLNSKITGLEQRKDNLKQQNKQLKEQISVLDKRLKQIEKK